MNHTMSNFFHEFAAAAQAMEELPKVRDDLAQANNLIAQLRDTIQRLELQAIDRRTEMETLHSRIRSLEVERDEAQFQALEEQDRTSAFKRFVEGIFGQAGNLLQAATPVPAPEPAVAPTPQPVATPDTASVPEPVNEIYADPPKDDRPFYVEARDEGLSPPVADTSHYAEVPGAGQSEVGEPNATTSIGSTPMEEAGLTTNAADATTSHSSGVSVPTDPTPATETSSENASNASGSSPARPDPLYVGKLYKDYPAYVPLHEWLAGGGTEADYYAR